MPSLLQSRGDFSLPGRVASSLVAVPTDPTCVQFPPPVDPSLGSENRLSCLSSVVKGNACFPTVIAHKVAFGDIRLHLRSEVPRPLSKPRCGWKLLPSLSPYPTILDFAISGPVPQGGAT